MRVFYEEKFKKTKTFFDILVWGVFKNSFGFSPEPQINANIGQWGVFPGIKNLKKAQNVFEFWVLKGF